MFALKKKPRNSYLLFVFNDQSLDGKVKIWNMKTLADPNIDATTEPSKHLCTMSVHNGKSLCALCMMITRQAGS